jgi:hypothetical protein
MAMSDKQVTTKHAADADAKKTAPPTMADRVSDALNQATLAITKTDVDGAAKAAQGDVEKLLGSMTKTPPRPIPDKDLTDPAVLPSFHDHKLAYDTADNTYDNARAGAVAQLGSDLNAWKQAQSQHDHAMGAAQVSLAAAVKTATDDYDGKYNLDSRSRRLNLSYKLREAVAAAIQQYENDANLAAGTLATAAGALLSAHATFLGSLGTASSKLLADKAAADQEYWAAVEQVIDAV